MREFFEWAKGEGAYTNESTGLHVGVSLPGIGGNIDYVKLALFLGDKYVLDLFDRDGNTYCKSAFDKISRVGSSVDTGDIPCPSHALCDRISRFPAQGSADKPPAQAKMSVDRRA